MPATVEGQKVAAVSFWSQQRYEFVTPITWTMFTALTQWRQQLFSAKAASAIAQSPRVAGSKNLGATLSLMGISLSPAFLSIVTFRSRRGHHRMAPWSHDH
ncbi:MAG TPA: hypothetical protein VM142_01570 [Acidimicrobiales bacterium]|nr:hypothetical protein [Acidimicrobiales bacterium]